MQDTADDRVTQRNYSERLYLPWYHWILPLVAAGLIAAEIHMGYPGVRSWLPYVVLLPLAVLLIVRMSALRVAVRDGQLWVGDAHVPVEHLGEAELIDPARRREALGPELDPSAFVRQRSWVKPLLRIEIADEQDPTPYWVVSTRHPQRLLTALRGEQT